MNRYIHIWRKSSKLLAGLIITLSLVFCNVGVAFAQTTTQIKLFGYVKDSESGLPISGTNIDLSDANGTPIANMNTGANGYYEFAVPAKAQFHISATVWAENGDYTLCQYIPAWTDLKPGRENQLETDFTLSPGANLIVYAYESTGSLVRRARMQEVTSENLYVTDMQDLSNGGQSFVVQDSYSIQMGQWDLTLPAFVVPLGVANRLHILWEVPGVGKTLLTIDNQGKGYTLTKPGDYYVIKNLSYEAAISEYARLLEEQTQLTSKGYSLTAGVLNEIQTSTNNIQAAEDTYAKSAPDQIEVTEVANRALKSILTAQKSLSLVESITPTATAQPTTMVKLSGHIRDINSGQPVSGAYLDLKDSKGAPITNMMTGSTGYYEFTVPRQDQYQMGVSVWMNSGGYSLHGYIPMSVNLQPGVSAELETNIDLTPAANLIVYAYDTSGSLIRRAKMQEITFGNLYVSGMQDLPNGGRSWAVKDTFSLQSNNQWDLALPAFVVPLGAANRLHVLWEVPGFGQVMLNIDNQGQGYTLSKQGDYYVIKNLSYEAAVSEYARLQEKQNQFLAQGHLLSTDVSNEIQDSTNNIQVAEAAYTNFTPDKPEVTDAANLALKSILAAQESLALLEANQSINGNRYGGLTLKVVDEKGNPVEGASVAYEQQSHDFLFGANPMGTNSIFNTTYATLLRDAGINFSYMLFPWEGVEPTPGNFEWGGLVSSQDMPAQTKYGFGFMGGLAFWFNRSGGLGTQFSPLYQDQMSFSELKTNVFNHMRAMAERYKDSIAIWEFNEQNASWATSNLTWNEKFELISTAIKGLKAGNPDAKVLFNGTALPYEFNVGNLGAEDKIGSGISFYEFLTQLAAHNINYAYIGLEIYYSGGNTDGYVPPCITMASFDDLLNLYSDLGKPIFIRELSAPSSPQPNTTWWHRPWDEATQAEYLKDIYTIAFSKPLVQEIGWSYGVSDEDAFIKDGGLLDSNLQPKASYFELKDLLTNQWITKGSGKTGSDGLVAIRGFAGDYIATVTSENGTSTTVSLHISERQNSETIVTLSAPTQIPPTAIATNKDNSFPPLPWWAYLVVALFFVGLLLLFWYRKRKKSI